MSAFCKAPFMMAKYQHTPIIHSSFTFCYLTWVFMVIIYIHQVDKCIVLQRQNRKYPYIFKGTHSNACLTSHSVPVAYLCALPHMKHQEVSFRNKLLRALPGFSIIQMSTACHVRKNAQGQREDVALSINNSNNSTHSNPRYGCTTQIYCTCRCLGVTKVGHFFPTLWLFPHHAQTNSIIYNSEKYRFVHQDWSTVFWGGAYPAQCDNTRLNYQK